MTPHLPDPRSDLVFEIRELNRRSGGLREFVEVIDAPTGLGGDVIGVPPGSPIDLDLRLESVVEGILVTGVVKAQLEGSCSRCLEPVSEPIETDFQELYCYPGKETDDADAMRIEGDLIDLEPVLRDAVVLELPFTPLCRPDCAGLCPTCGANLNRDPGHGHAEATDARWAGLAAWQQD